MLHDLLFSLLGKPGSFVKQFDNSPFYIDESLNLFSKPEIVQLNQIVNLGYHYQQIDNFLQNQEEKSSYIKALVFGIDNSLNDYRQTILTLEQEYLNEKMFIVSQLNVRLQAYYQILLNLHTSINIIQQHNMRGGQILDYLYERTLTGNDKLQLIYQNILSACYEVLFQQLSSWLQYGQILDTSDEFFIQRIDEKKKTDQHEYNWDTSFTLNIQMLPLHFITLQMADKILFIGKAVKVLKGQQELFINEHQQLIREIEVYDSFTFNRIIDQLQKQVGEQLVQVIVDKQELFIHLKNFYLFILLNNGNFIQQFLSDCQSILQLPQTQQALQELNFNLHKMDYDQTEKMDMFIYNNGFEYKTFQSLNNLQIKNNVIQTINILRMGPARGPEDWSGVFRDVKQSIENGFTLQIVFKFKQQLSKPLGGYSILQVPQDLSTSLVLLFCQDEENGVFIRLKLDQQKVSSLSVESKIKFKEEIIYKWKLDKIDFSEGDLHSLKINYQNDELSLIIDDTQSDTQCKTDILPPSQWKKVAFKFQKYFQLELGRCMVGIKQYGQIVDLYTWKMIGSNFLNDASWSGLTLKYQVDYPLSLLITPSLQEKFQLFFRYLFPIRHAQFELQQVWIKLTKKFKKKDCKYILGMHTQLMHVVNAFYHYFQMDIIAVQWSKMISRMQNEINFELMRKIMDEFEQSVSNQLFLNLQQIVKNIFQIIKFVHKYIELVNRIELQHHSLINKECYKLMVEFDTQFIALFNLIQLLTKSTNQTALFQLLTRLDYNSYFDNKTNEKF
ncbi:unnamed protein product (macronuclear) [Paramecium tetraurelia]|uniref:Spindle pole body component n=1 Tax=Paramecium tetraurelia TaxID=5888 RepID=A0C933_PARTE|nr:uncharacterized protein GSPATT00006606001 [Paramecium tetraurelia]CAK67300.1 unnamed protein product [Paramecium tetraurelia]|eukprot:XP_001434697.1 hypothetical protein (macronuclear) [Paramecium tetraurelia strain d4-2]